MDHPVDRYMYNMRLLLTTLHCFPWQRLMYSLYSYICNHYLYIYIYIYKGKNWIKKRKKYLNIVGKCDKWLRGTLSTGGKRFNLIINDYKWKKKKYVYFSPISEQLWYMWGKETDLLFSVFLSLLIIFYFTSFFFPPHFFFR